MSTVSLESIRARIVPGARIRTSRIGILTVKEVRSEEHGNAGVFYEDGGRDYLHGVTSEIASGRWSFVEEEAKGEVQDESSGLLAGVTRIEADGWAVVFNERHQGYIAYVSGIAVCKDGTTNLTDTNPFEVFANATNAIRAAKAAKAAKAAIDALGGGER